MPDSPRFDQWRDDSAACPACNSRGLEHFYQVDSVPTTSNLLMKTRQEALDWPRGDLRLATCAACGFITNTAFDPSTQQLTARYEATQACSPTFGKFARELAQGWIDRYQLRGKKILEIGCGQGEFISMMCEMAGASGWGVDPIVDIPRGSCSSRVTFIAEKFGPHLAHLDPDFILCRHTLEHIPDVRRFLRDIRQTIGDRRDVVLAIEVPDTLRVLREAAFWDIYYEHCSYFSAGSLQDALKKIGFEIEELRLEYGEQYLIAEAKPTAVILSVLAKDLATLENEARSFANTLRACPELAEGMTFVDKCERKLKLWRHQLSSPDECRVIWGSGSKAVGFITTLGPSNEIAAVVDINPAKHGTFLPGSGHEIVAPDRLRHIRPRRVIVMNPIYVEEIRRSLGDLGLSPELSALE